MPTEKKLQIVQDIFLLYELSLAVGGSLDPLENSRRFLQSLVSRKKLTYASVWLREKPGLPARLFCAIPPREMLQDTVPEDHYIWRELEKRSFFSLVSSHKDFRELAQETHIVKGAYAIFGLGELGFLKMFLAGREEAFPKMELSQLEAVIHKFKVSLEGCLAHDRLMEESRERLHMQQALERSNQRFSDLFENMNDALVIFDEEGRIVEANRAAKKLARIDQLPSANLWHLVPPDEIENTKAAFRTLIEKGEKTGFETRIVVPGGEIKHIQVNSSGIFRDGRLVGSRNIIRDISRQKAAERALVESEVRMRALIRNLQAGILLEDEDRKIVLVNQFFCDIFSIPAPPPALVGVDCSGSAQQSKALFTDPEGFVDGIERLLRARKVSVGEELRMADGRILERDYIPLYSNGKYLGHLWQYRDVTEKRQAAESIRKSEEKYRGIIENMELGLLEVDNDGRVVRAYDRFCDMTGYRPEELIGQEAEVILLPEDQRPVMHRQAADRAKGKAGIYEIQLRKKNGDLIWVLISGAPLIDADGNITGSLGIHYDITRQKELARELAAAKQQAEQARLAERQFLANMSHEIRTPMNAVIGMTHLLYETPIDSRQREYLDALRFSADTLLGIINNILDLSKIEAGELEIEERPFDLLQMVQSLQRTFQFKLKDKPIQVVLDHDERIQNLVLGDSTRLNQVLTNLMSNASKFTHAGEIGLRTICQGQDEVNCTIRFEVYDTGIGIPEDRIETIFENFKQADVQVTRQFGGTGLGLAIVKQLVELMNGRIEVRSREGVGSTFAVALPFKKTPGQSSGGLVEKDQIGPAEKVFLSGLTVLVVEDNRMNRKLISKLLEAWGCDYALAEDGQAALAQTADRSFDLILMDVHMPRMDGYETTRRIRVGQDNPNRETPIIALTAAALLDEKRRAMEAGMNDYLTKPYSPARLRRLVLRILGFQPSGQAGEASEQPSEDLADVRIDLAYLQELSGNDPVFIGEMLHTFLSETPETLRSIMDQLEAEEWEALYRSVHGLKSNCMMVGMKPQKQLAARIEKLLKSPSFDEPLLRSLLGQLDREIRAAFPLLEHALEKYDQ